MATDLDSQPPFTLDCTYLVFALTARSWRITSQSPENGQEKDTRNWIEIKQCENEESIALLYVSVSLTLSDVSQRRWLREISFSLTINWRFKVFFFKTHTQGSNYIAFKLRLISSLDASPKIFQAFLTPFHVLTSFWDVGQMFYNALSQVQNTLQSTLDHHFISRCKKPSTFCSNIP